MKLITYWFKSNISNLEGKVLYDVTPGDVFDWILETNKNTDGVYRILSCIDISVKYQELCKNELG